MQDRLKEKRIKSSKVRMLLRLRNEFFLLDLSTVHFSFPARGSHQGNSGRSSHRGRNEAVYHDHADADNRLEEVLSRMYYCSIQLID